MSFLRVDFLENYENHYGTERYEKALRWIAEEGRRWSFISLVMPNSFNQAATEIPYGDIFPATVMTVCRRLGFCKCPKKGQVKRTGQCMPMSLMALSLFRSIRPGKIMMDGDFMRLNKLADNEERKFLFSLMIMGGSALAIADQYDTATDEVEAIYKNEELLELHNMGFYAKPLSTDIHDYENSSRWVGCFRTEIILLVFQPWRSSFDVRDRFRNWTGNYLRQEPKCTWSLDPRRIGQDEK